MKVIALTKMITTAAFFTIGGFAPSAIAQSIGIDFATMPKGLQALYKGSDGRTWVTVYRGKKGRSHILESWTSGTNASLLSTEYYDTNGLLTKRIYADGNVRNFSPRRCLRVLGDCQFKVSNSRQGSGGSFAASVVKRGQTYTYTWRHINSAKANKSQYRLGQYTLAKWGKSGNFSWRLVKVSVK